jgi:hypothetical protein
MEQRQQKHVTYVSCCETCQHTFAIGPMLMRVQFPKFTVHLGADATLWSSLGARAMRRTASKPPYDIFQKRKPQARGQVSLPVSSTPFYKAETDRTGANVVRRVRLSQDVKFEKKSPQECIPRTCLFRGMSAEDTRKRVLTPAKPGAWTLAAHWTRTTKKICHLAAELPYSIVSEIFG